MLLKAGADASTLVPNRRDCLGMACELNSPKIVEMLLVAGAQHNETDVRIYGHCYLFEIVTL